MSVGSCTVRQAMYRCYHRLISLRATFRYRQMCWLPVTVLCVDDDVFVRHILETAVTERDFLEQLHELNHKISFVKEQSFKDARSCLDVRDTLEKLKIKVTLYHLVTCHYRSLVAVMWVANWGSQSCSVNSALIFVLIWLLSAAVSYTHLRAHETRHDLVCRLLLEKVFEAIPCLLYTSDAADE